MFGLTQARPAGGGVSDHGLLSGLSDDDHSIYALLAGRSGGQTLIGGSAASENLTLQSTAHATRGYVRAQDDLQLLSDILRDSGGNERLTLATSSPHLKATGEAQVTDRLGIAVAPDADYLVRIVDDRAAGSYTSYGIGLDVGAAPTNTFGTVVGVFGFARHKGSGTLGTVRGLDFQAVIDSAATASNMIADGVRMRAVTPSSGPASIAVIVGANIGCSPYMAVSTVNGVQVANSGGGSVTTVHGVKIEDQTQGTNRRCLEVGPTTPYLRVLGGFSAAANQTPLYISEGATPILRQLRTMDPGAGGANFLGGELVCVLV